MQKTSALTVSILVACLATPLALHAAEFVVKDIRVEGLQRIDIGTVFNEMPVQLGDHFDTKQSPEVLHALYKTGYFSDVKISRDGDTLVLIVKERPAIASITFIGNKDLKEKDLLEALKTAGIAEGETFDESVFSLVKQELEQQYFSRGKYAVKVETTVEKLERNRVNLTVKIDEGDAAKIRRINIVGNKAFSQKQLLKLMALKTPGWLSWITKDDQYAKEKLRTDVEALRTFYMDKGYINFEVLSTQVTITPDKKDIYITINVKEGEQYHIRDIKVAGKMVVSEPDLIKVMTVKQGDLFSRSQITASTTKISDRLGDEGYAFARVNPVPDIDEENKQIDLTFYVDPGQRVYVRRVNVSGNEMTDDQVVRRELRQMEGGPVSTTKIKRSQNNLMRLSYFSEATVNTTPVPGSTDLVDIDVKVKEQPAGSLSGGLGYSQVDGLLFDVGISQNNFLGTGNLVDFAFRRSAAFTSYRLGYNNPYYTIDGVSRGFDVYYQETDANRANITNYTRDVAGGEVTYGIPLSEFDRLTWSLGYENDHIKLGGNASSFVTNFEGAEGGIFNEVKTQLVWSRSTLDRAVFPTKGLQTSLGAEVMVPGSDLRYFKLTSNTGWYQPIYKDFIFTTRLNLGYGDGYAGTNELPYFENFYAGGIRSVRGFRDNTLGPRDNRDEPLGGNAEATATAELIFPLPFVETKALRTTIFVDAGNVYNTYGDDALGLDGLPLRRDNSTIRVSGGVSAQWLSPIGPFTFSLAQPIVRQNDDKEEMFQFTIGRVF